MDKIYLLYVVELKSIQEISNILSLNSKIVSHYIKTEDLKRKRDSILEASLRKLYLEDEFSILDLAQRYGKGLATIHLWLKKFGIEKNQNMIELEAAKKRQKTCIAKFGKATPLESAEIQDKIKSTNLNKYGFEESAKSELVKHKRIKTNLLRYGKTSTLQVPEVKEKIRKTNLEKYGDQNPARNLEIQNKIKATNLNRYGDEYAISSHQVREKIKKTNLERFGCQTPFQSSEVQNKIKLNNLKKYNVKFFSQTLKYKQIRIQNHKMHEIKGFTIKDLSEKYNLSDSTIRHIILRMKSDQDLFKVLNNYHNNQTLIEKILINEMDLSFHNKFFDKAKHPNIKYKVDFKIDDILAINVDGLYWHSEVNQPDKWYHYKLRETFENNQIRIMQFREDEVLQKLDIIKSMYLNYLGRSEKIFARKTQIRMVNQAQADGFLEKNHIMGTYKAKHIGLFIGNDLVSILSYKFYDSNLKIERFCSKLNTTIVGGFSKLLNYLEKNFSYNQIDYWVDLRYGTGKYLEALGFQKEKDTLGWKWTDFQTTYNRLQCRANMDDRKLSEKEYAQELGWHKIWDAGQRLYIRRTKSN